MSPSNIRGIPILSKVDSSNRGETYDLYYTPLQVQCDTITLDEDEIEVDTTGSKP
jgi:hypothetical protein